MSRVLRQTHRWLSISFVATVVLYIAVATVSTPNTVLTYLPLLPLFLLLLSGLYLFALPYFKRRTRT